MKVLKIVERIVFLVAVVVSAAALTLSLLMDEKAEVPAVGIVTASATMLGAGLTLLVLLIGAFLRENKGPVASKIGEGFVLAAILAMFGSAAPVLFFNEAAGLTVVLAFVGAIIYAVDAIVRFIIFIVKIVRPETAENNPDVDERIQNVLKWKQLADDGIISKEEFEEKRVKILGLDKK